MDAGSTTSRTRLVAGRYRLLDAVGSGGMGTVWRAEDTRLGRLVAVKEVRPPAGMTGPEYDDLRERTLREARAAARLSTPGAVAVHDVVEEDGRPYVVMELLAGRSLAAVVTEHGPLPPSEVARVGLSLVTTLAAAHRAGILHRDVKPANVVLAEDGRVVLTDFGIAKAAGDPQLTSTGVLLGSPAYIAPERARGEQAGPPSDLFALGATLFTAVEGRPPFTGSDAMATLLAVVGGRREPMTAAGPLEPVLTRLLDPDPERRPTAADTARALRAARETVRVQERDRTTPPGPAPVAVEPEQEGTLVVPVPLGATGAAGASPARAGLAGADAAGGGPPGAAAAPVRHPAPPSRRSPAHAPAAAPPAQGGPRRTPVLALLALVAALVVGAVGLWAVRGEDPDAPAAAPATGQAEGEGDVAAPEDPAPDGGSDGTTPDVAPSAGAPAEAPAGDTTGRTAGGTAGESSGGTAGEASGDAAAGAAAPPLGEGVEQAPDAPGDWTRYVDDAGWSVAHPASWQPARRDVRGQSLVQITAPEGGGRHIRVSDDGRAAGDPAARWRAFAAEFAARHPSYEEIGITDVEDYRYTPAADWEFTYGSGGSRLHVLDRMLFTDDGRAYALLVQGRDADEVRALFDAVVASFRPAGEEG